LCCPHCGEEFEPEDGPRPAQLDSLRRDYEPHRGSLILSLGNISMIVGGLALCSLGFGAVLSVPIGILAWVMANHDLERIRDGRMDPRGKARTQTGRTGAIAGILLGLIFAAFYALLYLAG
jgi:Na+/proline symporter